MGLRPPVHVPFMAARDHHRCAVACGEVRSCKKRLEEHMGTGMADVVHSIVTVQVLCSLARTDLDCLRHRYLNRGPYHGLPFACHHRELDAKKSLSRA